MLEGLRLSAGLGLPWDSPGWAGRSEWQKKKTVGVMGNKCAWNCARYICIDQSILQLCFWGSLWTATHDCQVDTGGLSLVMDRELFGSFRQPFQLLEVHFHTWSPHLNNSELNCSYIPVSKDICQHCREQDAEQCRGQNTAHLCYLWKEDLG